MDTRPDRWAPEPGSQRFAEALALAILRRQLPLKELSRRLAEQGTPLSTATLSHWQTGRSLPTREASLAALRELERILGTPVGQLAAMLPADHDSRWDPVRDSILAGRPLDVLHAMGIDPLQTFTNQYLHDAVRVSADGTEHHETTRHLVRADRDGLDRMAMVLRQDFSTDPAPEVDGVAGCTLGRVVQLDDAGLMAAELVFDRRLRRGELYAFTYRMLERLPAGMTEGGMTRVLSHEVPYLVMDATFEGPQPASWHYKTTPQRFAGQTNPSDAQLQQLPPGPLARIVVGDAAPGLHAVCWFDRPQPTAAEPEPDHAQAAGGRHDR